MGRSRYKFVTNENQPYYLTCTVINWMALFGLPDVTNIILDSLRFMIDQHRLTLHSFIIMEHHMHMIASGEDLSKEIGNFKSYTAKVIINLIIELKHIDILKQLEFNKKRHKTDQTYQFWQEGSHPQIIMDDKMLNQKLDYIHYNPVKCGYVEDPVHWRYSSYSNYYGQEGLLPIEILGP
jgi:putative transposase